MNLGKKGRPSLYPHSLMLFLGIIRVVFRLPYRQLEGFAKGMDKILSISAPDYTTLSLRIPKLEIDLGYKKREGEEVVIAVDSKGVKVTNRGEWMREKRKGYIKIHVAVDIKSKQVVSMEVSDEKVHDGEKLKFLVSKAKERVKVKKVLGDGGYDSHENFNFLAEEGIEAGIKVRSDSNFQCCGERGKVVRAYLSDAKRWKKELEYGKRWIVESSFQVLRGCFGRCCRQKGLIGW